MSKRIVALLGATLVSIIYGLTFTIAKDVMPVYVKPYGFIVLRVGVSLVLFWVVAYLMTSLKVIPTEKISTSDFPRIAAAAFTGVAFNMLTFFKGLSLTSPIAAAVIMPITPIIVLLVSTFLLRERMLKRNIFGIVIGLTGTVLLVLYGKSVGSATNANMGNLLVFLNAASYGVYLIVVKKLMDKYNAFNFVKYIYLFGFLMVLPFGWSEVSEISWHTLPESIWWKIVFVVVFSTFLTYLLNLLSMRELKPTTVAVFIYLQPLFAAVFAIAVGKDQLSWIKVISALMIFIGVALVTQKKKLKVIE